MSILGRISGVVSFTLGDENHLLQVQEEGPTWTGYEQLTKVEALELIEELKQLASKMNLYPDGKNENNL